MAVYKVLTDPNPVLQQVAKPVKNINAGVLRVLDNMRDTMYAANGVGLAAPQIGISKRIIVIDVGDGKLIELINPEIISLEGEQEGIEGCLSVPNLVGWVVRAKKVVAKGLNRAGEEVEVEGEDLLARALQHEIDHLEGILFTNRTDKLQRNDA